MTDTEPQEESSMAGERRIVALYHTGALSITEGQAQMLRGGAIVEVSNPEQAKIAEEAGACAVLIASDRMADPSLIKQIKNAVSILIMAKVRVGHFVEAQILEAIGVDYIDESEALAPADDQHHINKHNFRVPFVCGSQGLGQALRRVREGAALIRTEGDLLGNGDIAETVRNVRAVMGDIRVVVSMKEDEVFEFARRILAPYDLVKKTRQLGRLPVMHFAAGGIVAPADAALMMHLGCDGVFVGCGVFAGRNPFKRVRAVVESVMRYKDARALAELCIVDDRDEEAGTTGGID